MARKENFPSPPDWIPTPPTDTIRISDKITEQPRINSSPSKSPQESVQKITAINIIGTETRAELDPPKSRYSWFLKKYEKHTGDVTYISGSKLFTVYKVLVKLSSSTQWIVFKRYSEFVALNNEIQHQFPFIHKTLPDLPPKRIFQDNMCSKFIEFRSKALHHYLRAIYLCPVLLRSKLFFDFLAKTSNLSSTTSKISDFTFEHCKTDKSGEVVYLKPKAVFRTSPSNSTSSVDSAFPPTAAKSLFRSKYGFNKHNLESMDKKKPTASFLSVISSLAINISDSSGGSPNKNLIYSKDSVGKTNITLQDFYLLKLIGKGNFGKVMLAQHKDNNKVYAIKAISKSNIRTKKNDGEEKSHPHDLDHIMSERNVLICAAQHPFLISLVWAFQSRRKLFFVTDYVGGGELFFHLSKERRFSEMRARFYTAEIVSALEYLHLTLDVVYRDLKPENILLDSDGHVKLTDFGLAKEYFIAKNNGRTKTFCGTPEYLSPEVIRKESYGFSVDWWCMGVVLYEMLVGLPPFYSTDRKEMYQKILNEKLRFPHHVTVPARTFITGLLHRSSCYRLGSGPNNVSDPEQIKKHKFFEGLDWEKLYRKEYKPPYVPTVTHKYDVRNIDPTFLNEPIPGSILEDNIAKLADNLEDDNFVENKMFRGFSFAHENASKQ
jgi:serine/threonine protein kinase